MPSTRRIVSRAAHPEKRRDLRRFNPTLVVTIDGSDYSTVDWSLGGALIRSYAGHRGPEEEIVGSLRLETASESHPFEAEVVRLDVEKGQLAFRFTVLSDGVFTVLERAFMRGSR